jgi:hypothetical protein
MHATRLKLFPSVRMLPIHVLYHRTNEEDSYKGLAEG